MPFILVCEQPPATALVFGGILSEQVESSRHPGVPWVLVNLVTALRMRGLDAEGLFRVPGRALRVQQIESLANTDRLISDDELFDGRVIASAIKRYLAALPDSLLDVDAFVPIMAKEFGRSVRTPAGLARALGQMQAALTSSIGCPGGRIAHGRESGWRSATLNYVMCLLREVVSLRAYNRMSPRALALCLSPALFGTTDNAETNSQVLEFLIEHWPWLSSGLHRRGGQPVSALNPPVFLPKIVSTPAGKSLLPLLTAATLSVECTLSY
ncbi:unnamed protein product [Dibothriocephalus latus]|uniref:Rho-GAP domain-containing protein n=1 Tax=Dibothriocephalus latus TaxID=60516 RepID=A0A3P6P3M0_DIBLA|nr:unnamed protein product [Dibothriocephalus latus]